MRGLTITPGVIRRALVANVVVQVAIVVTGGVVRLTGSGLGCTTAPECTPGSSDSRRAPSRGVHRHRWISVGSPSDARNSTPSPAETTSRTCRPGGVTSSPATVRT